MISAVVYSALKSLVNNRCYPSTFPQSDKTPQTWPAIRFSMISIIPVQDICGTDDGATDDTHVQVDYVALTYGAMIALRDQGRSAMETLDPPALRQTGFEEYDAETKTHRCVEDYVFYPSSGASGSP